MADHYPDGHNVGLGMVEDTWEEKEIARLERDLSAARRELEEKRVFSIRLIERADKAERELAQAREWEEMASKMREVWCRRVHELNPPLSDEEIEWADEYVALKSPAQGETINAAGQMQHVIAATSIAAGELGSAPAAPGTAPQVSSIASDDASPAAAVSADPVVYFYDTAIRALVRHYEARGMRKAAEICKAQEKHKSLSGDHSHSQVARMECGLLEVAIERAAADLERKP